jgi:hypothetical protein
LNSLFHTHLNALTIFVLIMKRKPKTDASTTWIRILPVPGSRYIFGTGKPVIIELLIDDL